MPEPSGPSTLVFLHGQPGAGSDWDEVIAALPARCTALALDRPGYRSNSLPPGTVRANARWVIDQLDRAQVADAILVGHSYGGAIAVDTVSLAPGRVRALVLIASVGPGCLDGWDTILAAPVLGEICAVTAWLITPWFARRRLAAVQSRLGRPLLPGEHVSWETWGSARHEHGAMWRTFLLEQRELQPGVLRLEAALDRIAIPTLILADTGDRMIPIATAHALRDRISGARLVLIESGGHNLPRRSPQLLARNLTDFIEAVG
jgi:pimeloyl-ACP methyl ester carboxylesterase